MTTQPPSADARKALIERVRNIILKPNEEWDRIVAEPARIDQLYGGYVVPVAGAVAVVTFVLAVLTSFYFTGPLFAAILYLVGALAGTFIMAILINALAPHFGSQKDEIASHKLAVYSATPFLLSHVFMLHWMLSPLAILGLYGFFLLYLGMPKLMKTPEDKRLPFIGAVVLASLIVAVVLGALMQVAGGGWGGRYYGPVSVSQNASETQLSYPGGSLDAEELAKIKREAREAAATTSAAPPPVERGGTATAPPAPAPGNAGFISKDGTA